MADRHAAKADCFVVTALFFALVFSSERAFVFIVDHATCCFHEAGTYSSIVQRSLELYGGTVGQLVFPGAAVSFWRKGNPFGGWGGDLVSRTG